MTARVMAWKRRLHDLKERKLSGLKEWWRYDAFEDLGILFAVALVGAAVPAILWGLWYFLGGSMPKFMGISRFCLDTISGAIYALVVMGYWARVEKAHDWLSDCGKLKVRLRDFVKKCPWLSLFGLFLAVDFVASIFLSLAVGLAGILALAVVVGVCYGIRRLWIFVKKFLH